MVEVVHLECALVRRDFLGVTVVGGKFRLGDDAFLVAEHDTAEAREARTHRIDARLHVVGVGGEGFVHKRTRSHDTHVAEEDVEYLGDFVDFRLAEELPERQYTRITRRGVESARHVRAVQKHSGELPDLEMPVIVADAVLAVEDVMFARALQHDHHRYEQR